MEEKINEIGKTYFRPWGCYKTLDMADNFQCKVISIRPKGKLSLQKHLYRSEHWIIIKGPVKVTKGQKEALKNTNDHIFIEKEEIHRLENTTDKDVILIEVQIGHYLGEDDIIRLEDVYGRN